MKVQALQTGVQLRKVRSRFVERFSMGAPLIGGEVRGPAITGACFKCSRCTPGGGSALESCGQREAHGALLCFHCSPVAHPVCLPIAFSTGLNEKINWVEKFVAVGRSAIDEAAKAEHERWVVGRCVLLLLLPAGGRGTGCAMPVPSFAAHGMHACYVPRRTPHRRLPTCSALEQQRQRVRRGSGTGPADVGDALAAAVAVAATRQQAAAVQQRLNFNLGVLQFTPSSEPFPLLVDAVEVRGSAWECAKESVGALCGSVLGCASPATSRPDWLCGSCVAAGVGGWRV